MVCFNFDICSPCLKSKEEAEGSVATPLPGETVSETEGHVFHNVSTKSDITIMLA